MTAPDGYGKLPAGAFLGAFGGALIGSAWGALWVLGGAVIGLFVGIAVLVVVDVDRLQRESQRREAMRRHPSYPRHPDDL